MTPPTHRRYHTPSFDIYVLYYNTSGSKLHVLFFEFLFKL